MSDSLDISRASFVEKFEQLKPRQQRRIIEVVELMIADRDDVYFLVCFEGNITYQGYCINTALDFNNKGMGKLIRQYEADQTKIEHEFLCVYPDNAVFDFGIGGGVE